MIMAAKLAQRDTKGLESQVQPIAHNGPVTNTIIN